MTTDTKVDGWIAVYNDGVAHFQAGRLEEAENRFRAAAAAVPAHSVIRLNHGFTLKLLGRRDEALASFRAVLERDVWLDGEIAAVVDRLFGGDFDAMADHVRRRERR